MTDDYCFSGSYRYAVPVRRGEEKKTIEICADDMVCAEHLAIIVANNYETCDWETDCDEDAELDGLPDIIDEDPCLRWGAE